MEILIITSLLGDYSKIAEEIERELEGEPEKDEPCRKQEEEPEYDLRTYKTLSDRCNSLERENRTLSDNLDTCFNLAEGFMATAEDFLSKIKKTCDNGLEKH